MRVQYSIGTMTVYDAMESISDGVQSFIPRNRFNQRVAVLVKELIHPWLNSTPFVDDH